jgi:hypothetical protein
MSTWDKMSGQSGKHKTSWKNRGLDQLGSSRGSMQTSRFKEHFKDANFRTVEEAILAGLSEEAIIAEYNKTMYTQRAKVRR